LPSEHPPLVLASWWRRGSRKKRADERQRISAPSLKKNFRNFLSAPP
jgi:hypothetical protein